MSVVASIAGVPIFRPSFFANLFVKRRRLLGEVLQKRVHLTTVDRVDPNLGNHAKLPSLEY